MHCTVYTLGRCFFSDAEKDQATIRTPRRAATLGPPTSAPLDSESPVRVARPPFIRSAGSRTPTAREPRGGREEDTFERATTVSDSCVTDGSPGSRGGSERRRPDSNRSRGLCRPLPSHSATAPSPGHLAPSGAESSGLSVALPEPDSLVRPCAGRLYCGRYRSPVSSKPENRA